MARQLDPLSLIIATDRGQIFHYARRYDRAIEQFRAVQEMDPKSPRVHLIIYSYVESGRFAEALADLEVWKREWGDADDAGWVVATEAYVNGRAGQIEKARAALRMLQRGSAKRLVNPAALVLAELGVGDTDAALDVLRKAGAEHSNVMTALKVDPAYDPLRGDARFEELLRYVGLDK
jgi:tetratricopeptide (TPR) repeat protein